MLSEDRRDGCWQVGCDRAKDRADFDEHGLEQCAVVERLEVGAPACFTEDGLRLAWADDSAYGPLGRVDVAARLREWRAARSSSEGGTGA